jgi:hypothetical protein
VQVPLGIIPRASRFNRDEGTTMRRLALLALLLCAVSAGQARANAFGQMIPASPLYGGNNLFGGYLLFGDRVGNDVGLLGQVRLSSSPKFDWGLQFGYAGSDPSQILIGGDIRPVLHAANDDFPLDLAFDAGLGLSIADHFTILDVVPAIEGSHKFDLSGSSSTLTPYMSIGLDINHISVEDAGDDTETDIVARFGLEWEATRKLAIMAELGVGDPANDFILGVNVPF